MQTFLTHYDYYKSAEVLDNRRLNKQIVECSQIYKALTVPNYGWQGHPAVKMWRRYEGRLLLYGLAHYYEWQQRWILKKRAGKQCHKSGIELQQCLSSFRGNAQTSPEWRYNSPDIYSSHRAALLYKDYAWYSQFGWNEKPAIPDLNGSLPYHWPVS